MKTITQNNHKSFSVMTINLRFGLAEDGPNNWIYRKKSFRTLFKLHQPDFIAMQEANDFQIDYFQEILGAYDYIGRRAPAPPGWQDNIIFYKNTWQCRHKEQFYLSETPSIPSMLPGSKWPRQCILGLFEKEGRSLICASTHFDFEDAVQVRSAQIILEKLSRFPEELPVILMGDFNNRPFSNAYLELTSPRKTLPALQEIFQSHTACTHHAFTGECKGGHIDWILYRGGIKNTNRQVLAEKFEDKYPSDHFPVLADFQWGQTC
jgi:endonuclease/exonuclease/phosphatase family metal-dependent hydrolase